MFIVLISCSLFLELLDQVPPGTFMSGSISATSHILIPSPSLLRLLLTVVVGQSIVDCLGKVDQILQLLFVVAMSQVNRRDVCGGLVLHRLVLHVYKRVDQLIHAFL